MERLWPQILKMLKILGEQTHCYDPNSESCTDPSWGIAKWGIRFVLHENECYARFLDGIDEGHTPESIRPDKVRKVKVYANEKSTAETLTVTQLNERERTFTCDGDPREYTYESGLFTAMRCCVLEVEEPTFAEMRSRRDEAMLKSTKFRDLCRLKSFGNVATAP